MANTSPLTPPDNFPDAPDEPETDAAVDDIAKKDSDELLKIQDAKTEEKPAAKADSGWRERFKDGWVAWWANPKKRYGTLGGILLVLVVLFAVPLTRYDILGLVLKGDATVSVVDSKTGKPVSGVIVSLGGKQVKTEANGKAVVHARLGNVALSATKKYYKSYSGKATVTFSKSHNQFRVPLLALGQQVPIKVVDKVSGKPLADAVLNVNGAETKTGKDGMASAIIQSSATTQTATLSLSGYNTVNVTVTAASKLVAGNTFSLTPSGKLYFLSNLSGKIDVVKTNLDGTDRQTVLAGTGHEDPNDTSLLASRDWKYLALLSRRAGEDASVYLIDTTNGDKLTTVDEGNASFTFVGWAGDRFIYEVDRTATISDGQNNQYALKSLNAATGQTLLLDQTQASTSDTNYVEQTFGSPYIIGNQVIYAKNWHANYYNQSLLSGTQAELDSINADGSSHKVIKTFPIAANSTYVDIISQLYEPDGMYLQVDNGSNNYSYYDYDNGSLSADSTLTDNTFYSTPYPTYLLSPSGNSTFWSEQRDGKNTLFTGDSDANNQKQIATLSDYSPYGWYTDNYLLVSKDSSELYIMPAAGGTPLKITDYYKPAINYNGYGGGYGGL